MTILSIDPGTLTTGWQIIKDKQIKLSGTLKPQKDFDPTARSIQITIQIEEIISKYLNTEKIDEIVIESQYVRQNAKSQLILTQLVGMITYQVFKTFGIMVHQIQPSKIYNIIPFTSKSFTDKKQYHKQVLQFIVSTTGVTVSSIDEQFAIGLGLQYFAELEKLTRRN